MILILHWILIAMYLLTPLVALAAAMRRGSRVGIWLAVAMGIGTVLGTGLTWVQAREADGHANFTQFVVAIYLATALVLMLKGFDVVVRRALRIAPGRLQGLAPALMNILRGAILIVLGLPYLVSVLTVYRPKVLPQNNPMSELKFSFEPVNFSSIDGVRLSGWWIPAAEPPRRRGFRSPDYGTKTVLLCHSFGGNKGTQLELIRQLVPAGYNALAFDFRGHGASGGQLTSLGDLERRDVLGAVQWVRGAHPEQSQHIVGIGADMGAAALIAAAADRGELGQSIEAVAVYGAYDDLSSLAQSTARDAFSPPMDWIASHLGLSLASLHAGTDLGDFKPSRLVHDLWPRPILIIHGTNDWLVPFEHGKELFDAATFPKQVLWLPREDQDDAMMDDNAASTVRNFFDSARPIPAI